MMHFLYNKPFVLFILFSFLFIPLIYAQPIPVRIVKNPDNTFTLLRGGEPYFIKGAGGETISLYPELVSRGGNSVRTWGVNSNTGQLLDAAHELGISVMLGLWVGHQAHGFNYDDPVAVENQLQRFRNDVLAYRNHPALLAWAIGNEAEVGASNMKLWDAINDISKMIHEVDTNHITLTVTAGISTEKANIIAQRASDLDMIGVNSYAGISSVAQRIGSSNLDKPYVITEWGVNGTWEVGETSWGAPLEQTSLSKAQSFQERYRQFILPNKGKLLGSYAFLWGSKFEGTHTWFGLFVKNETTEMTDVLSFEWSGSISGNRAPQVSNLILNGKTQSSSVKITKFDNNWVEVSASDPDQDTLSYEFLVLPETGTSRVVPIAGATYDAIPGIIVETQNNRARLRFDYYQHNFKIFRLYALVRDGKGGIGTATFPFRTELEDGEYQMITYTSQKDAYVRDGPFADVAYGINDINKLQVKKSNSAGFAREAFLEFDLSDAPSNFDKVSLELFGKAPDGTRVEVKGFVNHDWSESTLNWNNRVSPQTGQIDITSSIGTDKQWWSWDVTAYINANFLSNIKTLSFVLLGTDELPGDPAEWDSRETGANAPLLRFYLPTHISRELNKNISVFPNPAINQLIVELPEGVFNEYCIRVYSPTGLLLLNETITLSNTNNFEINTSQLSSGIYMVNLRCLQTATQWTASFMKK